MPSFFSVAEVLTQSINNDPTIVGVHFGSLSKKTAAYADDTAILCSNSKDFDKVLAHLDRYERATGMKRNVKKTEVVTNSDTLKKKAKLLGYDMHVLWASNPTITSYGTG